MKFGNASWGLRETPLCDQLKITGEMGLSVLELGIANAPMDIPLSVSESELDEVKALFSEYGIELLCAATGNDFSAGNARDVEKIKRVTDICSYLGIKILRIFAGFSPASDVTGERWDNMISCLSECVNYANSLGVTLTVETHGGVRGYDDGVVHFNSVTTDTKLLAKMLSELPEAARLNFDPANLSAVGIENISEFYLRFKDKIGAVHLKDFVSLPSGHKKPAACGEGSVDFRQLLGLMSDLDVPMLYEYEVTDDIKDGLKRCDDHIKSVMK